MVLAYVPQRMKRALATNSNYQPQGSDSIGALFDTMAYEDLDIMGYEPDNWLDAQFLQRTPLTINVGQVPSTQTDFPLLINDTFPELIGNSEAELRFASTDDIPLKYEIEKFNTLTGELIAWIKKPTVNDGDILFVYFDNPTAVDQQDPTAVWSNNFVVVQHMNQQSGNILDSTANSNDGTPFGSPINATGQIGDAKDLPADTDGFFAVDNNSLDTTDITVSAWVNPSSMSGGTDLIASKWFNPLDNDWQFGVAVNFLIVFLASGLVFGGTVPNGVFTHVTFTVTGGILSIYINGVFVNSSSSFTKPASTISRLQIGDSGGSALVGIIDEFRMSNDGKSADWIKTEFNNQKDPSIFYSTGTVESVPTTFDKMGYEA